MELNPLVKIGIVIPFYNGYQYINKLLESISLSSSGFCCKVYIIDNSLYKSEIKNTNSNLLLEVISEKPGIGYGKACNIGYQLCCKEGMDYMIITNQDGYFSERLIETLIKPFSIDDTILISAPILMKYGSNEVEDFFIKYYLAYVPQMVSDLIINNVKAFYFIDNISGACFAFDLKKNPYSSKYLFDPLFHMYYEDEDLCRRVKNFGLKIALIPREAIFYHQHSHTNDKENEESIKKNQLYSEKVFRLKDKSKSITRILYGIFVTTLTQVFYHLLRAEWKKAFAEITSVFPFIANLRRIINSRNLDFK